MAELMTEETAKQEMIVRWEELQINDPQFAKMIAERVEGDEGPHQRDYYKGFSQAVITLFAQISYAPKGGQTAAAYMIMYVEWQLNRI